MDAPLQSGRGALIRCSNPLDLTANRRLKIPRHLAEALLYGRPKQTCGERRLTARARLYGQKNPASVCAKAGSCEAGFKRLAGSRGANSKSLFVISLFKIGRRTLHWAEGRRGKGWRDIRFTLPVLAVLTQPQEPPMSCPSVSTIRKYRAEPRPLYCHRRQC